MSCLNQVISLAGAGNLVDLAELKMKYIAKSMGGSAVGFFVQSPDLRDCSLWQAVLAIKTKGGSSRLYVTESPDDEEQKFMDEMGVYAIDKDCRYVPKEEIQNDINCEFDYPDIIISLEGPATNERLHLLCEQSIGPLIYSKVYREESKRPKLWMILRVM